MIADGTKEFDFDAYSDENLINIFYRENISALEMFNTMREESSSIALPEGCSLWNVEDELKEFEDMHGSKLQQGKLVVRGTIGSRGYYEGCDVIREGDTLYEYDTMYGTDFWKLRKANLDDLSDDWWSDKEEYDLEVDFWKYASNDEISYERLFGVINFYGKFRGSENNEEEAWYYFLVNRLR